MEPSTVRLMTKSPLALTQVAYQVAKDSLDKYSSHYSRKDFTQHQLFAILSLRIFFRVDYRGIVQIFKDFTDLQKALGLKKIPHYSTLCYAEQRLLKKGLLPSYSELSSVALAG
jgi:hypothetical protein